MITLVEQIAEAQRELALRKRCYPQWVKSGKLDAGDAKWQTRVQEAILRTLMDLDAEQRQLALFGPAPAARLDPEEDLASAACPYCGKLGNGEPCNPCCGA